MINHSAHAWFATFSREDLEATVRDVAAKVFFGEHNRPSFPGYFAALHLAVKERADWYRPGGDAVDYRGLLAKVDQIAAAL